MTPDQVFDLLKVIATGDRRTIGEPDVAFWGATVGELEFEDARDAVLAHFCERPDTWLMPGHVLDRVKAVRAARLEAAGDIQAAMIRDGVDPDDPNWQQELVRRRGVAMCRQAVADRQQLVGRPR